MKTVCLLLFHCVAPVPPPPFGGCAFNDPAVVTSLIWAVAVVLLGGFALFYLMMRILLKKDLVAAAKKHELAMKDKSNEIEEKWFDKNRQAKDDELARKIREYEELTIRQRLLDKVIDAKRDKDIGDIKATLVELKQKYETLDGEIEKIFIKKKK